MKSLVLCLALVAAPSLAFADDFVFTTVDDVSIDWNARKFTVTGIVSGEATARSVSRYLYSDTSTGSPSSYSSMLEYCQRASLMAMNRPGRFTLTVTSTEIGDEHLIACKLKRNQ